MKNKTICEDKSNEPDSSLEKILLLKERIIKLEKDNLNLNVMLSASIERNNTLQHIISRFNKLYREIKDIISFSNIYLENIDNE